MSDIVCTCVYEAYIDKPMSIWTTVLDFVFSVAIAVAGVILNYKLMRKLQIEKRSKPIGRKGNVIEPIMQPFCKFQIIYWPFFLLYFWIHLNGIIPSSSMNGWWCIVIFVTIVIGRIYISSVSLFVALVRYLYIVHRETANKWDYERVGNFFKIGSVVFPTILGTIRLFVYPSTTYQNGDKFQNCIAFYLGTNNTSNMTIPKAYPYAWTLEYIPEKILDGIDVAHRAILLVIVLNIAEAFLYFSIYRQVKRDNYQSFSVGAVSEASYLRGEKRSLISLQMCFVASMVEIMAVVTAILSAVLGAQLQDFKIPNIHFPDVIVMSIIIPFIYLLNDDSEKEVIFQSGWCQGFRYVLGIYTTPAVANDFSDRNRIPVARLNYNQNLLNFLKIPRRYSIPRRPDGSISRRKISFEVILQHGFKDTNKIVHADRRHSVGNAGLDILSFSLSNSKIYNFHQSIDLTILRNNSELKQKIRSMQSSHSSISTIYL